MALQNVVALVFGAGCLGAMWMCLFVGERAVARAVSWRVGWRVLWVTGLLGVTLHEWSHRVVAHMFGFRLINSKILEPDPSTRTLGYTRTAPSKHNVVQWLGQAGVGVAPGLCGAGLALCCVGVLVSAETRTLVVSNLVMALRDGPWDWGAAPRDVLGWSLWSRVARDVVGLHPLAWVGLWYGLGSVAAHMAPSTADVRGCVKPLVSIFAWCILLLASLGFVGVNLTSLAWSVVPFAFLLLLGLSVQATVFGVVVVYVTWLEPHLEKRKRIDRVGVT